MGRQTGAQKRERICGCSHEQSRHKLVDAGDGVMKHIGRCEHGCGCEGLHSRRSGGRKPRLASVKLNTGRPDILAAFEKMKADIMRSLEVFRKNALAMASGGTATSPLRDLHHVATMGAATISTPSAKVAREARRELAPRPAPSTLPKGERRVLTVIAQHPHGVDRDQITAITGYKKSTRDAYVKRLADRGLIDVNLGTMIVPTPNGLAELGPNFAKLPTGDELLRHWLERLPAGESVVLQVVARVHPSTIGRERITEITDYKKSTRDAYLHRLQKKKLLVVVGEGVVRASDTLFG